MPGMNDESYMNELRGMVNAFLESKPVTYFMIGVVFFYAIFILVSLSIESYISGIKEAEDFFNYVDYILITYFMFEIVVRFIGSGISYFLCNL